MERISIQEIAAVLTVNSKLKKKDAERFAMMMFDVVKDALETERLVKIKGLGTFKVIDIEARESINVNTGERVVIDGHEKITFTPDAAMKELVNKPFSQFETVPLNDGVEFDDMDSEAAESSEESEEEASAVDEVIAPVAEEVTVPVIEADETPAAEEVSVPVAEEKETPLVSEEEEPTVEETPTVEENPFIEETPSIDEAPAVEALSVSAEGEDVHEEETEPMLEFFDNNDEGTDDDDEETDKKPVARIVWPLLALLACLLSFAAGYLIGKNTGTPTPVSSDRPAEKVEVAASVDTVAAPKTVPVAEKDTTAVKAENPKPATSKPVEASKPIETSKPVETPKPIETPKPVETSKPAVTESTEQLDKYSQMDARVRTGAYRIVGMDYEVKVRAGETLDRIARRTIGPDMECYIEVYNGIKGSTELKAGQSLKIPKLELKKKKKSTN